MSKSHESSKQAKKKALLTPKENKAAKQLKKQRQNTAPPLVTH